jgi:hypothetical protein
MPEDVLKGPKHLSGHPVIIYDAKDAPTKKSAQQLKAMVFSEPLVYLVFGLL